jgi:hypothetical protein
MGRSYYTGLSTFSSDITSTIVDFATVAQLGLPTDRAYKIDVMKITITSMFDQSPFRVRAQLGDVSHASGITASANKVFTPMRPLVIMLRSKRSSDFIVTKDSSSKIAEVTVFQTVAVKKVWINFECWARIGPPLTD